MSVDDLFSSKNSVYYNSESSEFSHSKEIPVIKRYGLRKRNHTISFQKPLKSTANMDDCIPNFSIYENHDLIVESSLDALRTDSSSDIFRSTKESLNSYNNVSKLKCQPTFNSTSNAHLDAFCSTPEPTHYRRAQKNGSGDFIFKNPFNVIECTPIHGPAHVIDGESGNTICKSHPRVHFNCNIENKSFHQNLVDSLTEKFRALPLSNAHNASFTKRKSSAYIKRLSRQFRVDSDKLNRSYLNLYETGDLKGALLKISCQSEYKSFAQLFPNVCRKSLRKIGEGCFGEVFSYANPLYHGQLSVIKLIPIEGEVKFNGERQKSFSEILSEVIVSREVTALSTGTDFQTSGFVELRKVNLVQGLFAPYLKKAWNAFDKERESENDNPNIFPKNQIWLGLEYAFGGSTLENNVPKCPAARLSIAVQVAITLAVAESVLRFEHRDLHWGNILIRDTSGGGNSSVCRCAGQSKSNAHDDCVRFRLDNKEYCVRQFGVVASIIDFTLSRLEQDDRLVYIDLASDPVLFESEGDYQFDIYRFMRDHNRNEWKTFNPKTNVMWFHYLIKKLLPKNSTKADCDDHARYWNCLEDLEQATGLFAFDSICDLIANVSLFSKNDDFIVSII